MTIFHMLIAVATIGAVAAIAAMYLIWLEERGAQRRKAALAYRLDAVRREYLHRPRVPAITTPLPNLKGISK